MNIIVCVKQTPEAGRGELDRLSGTVKRTEGRQVINPFDLYAMEAALRLQEKDPAARIIAVSMGPESAGSVLRDCIALGADTGYLVTDPSFAGSDVRGTAHVLARAIRVIGEIEQIRIDAVFCGAKTIDGGTSMLGPELATILEYPRVTYALQCSFSDGSFTVEKEDDRGNRIYSIGTPCLLTFTKASFPVRYPAISRILEAESMELPVLRAADLDAVSCGTESDKVPSGTEADKVPSGTELNKVSCGVNSDKIPSETPATASYSMKYTRSQGAALHVEEVRYRKLEKKSQIIEDPDPARAVAELSQILYSKNVL